MSFSKRLLRFRCFWIFPALAIVLLYIASRVEPQRPNADLVWLFCIGVFMWTLLEYGLHRFVFHIHFQVRSRRLRELLNASHMNHHAAPRNADKLLVRAPYAMAVSLVLFAVVYSLSRSLFSTAGSMAGIWAGFLYYEAVHYRVHLTTSPSGLIAIQRRAHFHHHYTNHERCFGVTSPLWDHVFGTQLRRGQVVSNREKSLTGVEESKGPGRIQR
jgi:4-hydroxysphinganine ceramide fatty acyl 2-hydroxylase